MRVPHNVGMEWMRHWSFSSALELHRMCYTNDDVYEMCEVKKNVQAVWKSRCCYRRRATADKVKVTIAHTHTQHTHTEWIPNAVRMEWEKIIIFKCKYIMLYVVLCYTNGNVRLPFYMRRCCRINVYIVYIKYEYISNGHNEVFL